MVKAWVNCPLPIIPKDKRLKGSRSKRPISICKGRCNSLRQIDSIKYQLCKYCIDLYKYVGVQCDVPSCDSVGDGSTPIYKKDIDGIKFMCNGCKQTWRRNGKQIWNKFVEDRVGWLARPKTFVKALEEGLVSPVKNPVKQKEIAECHLCNQYREIRVVKYQLCSTCGHNLQFHGEKCSMGGAEPCSNNAVIFDTDESRFVCNSCSAAVKNYSLASYRIYESQIRTITECMICNTNVSHNLIDGDSQCSAFIDHNHETDKVRGILCIKCNFIEGAIDKLPISSYDYVTRLKSYLENPPLDIPIQKE